MILNMKDIKYAIRPAKEEDLPALMDLIKQLAVYEKLMDIYTATEELYRRYGFSDEAIFEALLVENESSEGPEYLGMALYFYTYSTFTGRPTHYLEDIFVIEEYRGRGIGTKLLVELAKIAVEKGCGRME
jgi:GNAT superfamily N-acetyltransferase